jgi:uncharacterized protein
MAIVPAMTELSAPLSAPYWEAAREGRLVVQECQQCRRLRHPPLPACAGCHSHGFGWREVSGAGTVYSYTVVTHPTHVAFADQVPYVVAIVELAEGPWLVTGITGCLPGEVRVGMPVHAVFREVAAGVTLPYFEAAHSRPHLTSPHPIPPRPIPPSPHLTSPHRVPPRPHPSLITARSDSSAGAYDDGTA